MYEFKLYIENILKGSNANKKQKNEMIDEFMDHLGLLKQEHLNDGLAEEDAIKKAIENFGNSVLLNRKLSQVSSLRTIQNFLSGMVLIFIIYIIERNTWMIYPGIGWPMDFKIHFVWMIGGLIGILPFGYFIPLFYRKANNVLFISCISIIYAAINIKIVITGWRISWGIHPAFTIGCVLGGLLGWTVLRLINNILWTYKKKNSIEVEK
jgi:hypothetical protein